jgi:predicted membrane protein
MAITSLQFIVFCIILTVIYFILPGSWQWILLLGFSIWFYTRSGYAALVFLLVAALALSVLSLILSRFGPVCAIIGLVVNLGSYVLLFWYILRAFSRNIEKRNRENRRFLAFRSRLTDKQNRYYRCPNCKQTVRVPRGRGKICIKCPKCSEKFVRKS